MARRLEVSGLLLMGAVYVSMRLSTGAMVAVLDTPYYGNAGSVTDLAIPSGVSAHDVAEMLQENGVIRSARDLRWWMRWKGTAGAIHSGQYRFERPLSLRQATEIIVKGRVLLSAVTFIEGATRWQVAEALAAAGFGNYKEAWEATGNVALVADLDTEATDLEGFLFPDTYHASHDAGPGDIVEMMVARFREVWIVSMEALAEEASLSVRDVLTIASLVEAETGQASERALVSGVYHNRLERRMLLQCDPTLLYALRLEGRTDRNIRRADFENESPYNTYRFAGLPPGPVGNPGEASIEAALYPAQTDYLYFVGRNDGSHVFSRTLEEHNANVNRYQR
ncbi:MAG TPA: endolytic transglycosylase MltG [Acidobacteria bacterium]|nr:endolytic transglycosylase MltG [Acidobacteriota bacterium]